MLTKQDRRQSFVEVTFFSLPSDVHGETVYLVGDFNNWDETATFVKRLLKERLSLSES